jgi:hypothetical protein
VSRNIKECWIERRICRSISCSAELRSVERPRAVHLAFACGYELDYLVTWNCAHIANAELRRRLMALNTTLGLQTPIICTPEELMGVEEADHV